MTLVQNPPMDIQRVSTACGPMWVFTTDVYVSRSLAVYGEYGAAETELFRQIVRPGMTVVEVGANIGSHSVFLARACAPGPFLAFEPQQRVFQVLVTNLTINGVTNARAYPEALGDAPGTITIRPPDYARPGNFGGMELHAAPDPAAAGTLPVRVTRLDDWDLPACAFLKIDVEGWERAVLAGAAGTIARCRPVLYVENDRAAHQAALIDQIHAMGYRLYWHVAALFRPGNTNGVAEDIFNNTVSLNMLCVPREMQITVSGFEEIDPANWTSPIAPG